VPPSYITAGPGLGLGPKKLAPGKWKREPDVDGHEKYSQDWESMAGKMHVELVVSKDGNAVSYLAPSKVLYKFKSIELVDDIPITEFKIDPPEGFVCFRVDGKMPKLMIGMPLDEAMFSKGSDKIEAHSFIAMYDPEVYDATALKTWFNKFEPRAKRLIGTRGESTEALSISPEKFDSVFSSSPTLILTNEKGIIVGLWMGFDPAETKEMELEIRQLLFEHT
ncbi:MAG TPA: hypothetical protein VK171_12830, partial [Fimbriimonas sp.]|nr:hypothetical protein [Fimbriimonas sp.]